MVKLDNICRVCLHSKGITDLFDDYGTDEQFRFCTSLGLEKNDGLPDKLCKICTGHLRLAYDFRSQAIYAEKYFRTICNKAERAPTALDENMQEIDSLLPIEKNGYESCIRAIEAPAIDVRTEYETKSSSAIENFELSSSMIPSMIGKSSYEKEQKSPIYNSKEQNQLTIVEQEEEYSEGLGAEPNKRHDDEKVMTKPLRKKCMSGKVECNICGTTFTHINSLKQHLMKHSGERPFHCEFCEKCFSRRTILNIHRRLHTGERPYKCDECVRTFVTKEAKNRHKERDHGDQPSETNIESNNSTDPLTYTCTICNKHHCSKYTLHRHMRTEHIQVKNVTRKSRKNLKYFCKICQQNFFSKKKFNSHQHKRDQLWFECEACHSSFERKYQLFNHLQSHQNSEILLINCTNSLQMHKEPLQIRSFFSCVCKKSFTKLNVLRLHQNTCKISENTVANNTDTLISMRDTAMLGELSPHRVNKGATEISSSCNKLNYNENLQRCVNSKKDQMQEEGRDILIGSSEHFECRICQMEFENKLEWIFHQELHKSQNHKCKKCGDTFAIKQQFLKHIKSTHFDKRNLDYQCNDCAAVLYDMRDLKLHLHEAHGLPPKDLNSCNLCDCVDFGTTSEYYKHVYEKHDSVNKFCNECDEYFDSRKAFDKHVFTHYIHC